MRRSSQLSIGVLAVLLLPHLAEARGPWHSYGWGGGLARVLHCGPMLMHAPADVLGAQLGLSTDQVRRIEGVRGNFFNRRADLLSAMEKQRIKLHALLDQDLPAERQVLEQMRKLHALLGKLHEERVKAHQRLLRVLSKKQRAQARKQCSDYGAQSGGAGWGRPPWGRGWGRGACRGWGGWGGWGRGPEPGGRW